VLFSHEDQTLLSGLDVVNVFAKALVAAAPKGAAHAAAAAPSLMCRSCAAPESAAPAAAAAVEPAAFSGFSFNFGGDAAAQAAPAAAPAPAADAPAGGFNFNFNFAAPAAEGMHAHGSSAGRRSRPETRGRSRARPRRQPAVHVQLWRCHPRACCDGERSYGSMISTRLTTPRRLHRSLSPSTLAARSPRLRYERVQLRSPESARRA
jgi:hypothetical protein